MEILMEYQQRDKFLSCIFLMVLLVTSLTNAFAANDSTLTDDEIKKAIVQEFEARSDISSEEIKISVNAGIVTLTGNTENLLDKERLREVALAVRGVKAVLNRLNVKDTNISDEEIRKDIKQALLLNAATDSYEVSSKVERGVVTLTGNVDSWNEALLSEKVAKSVKGVKDVKNNIVFTNKANRVDSEIASGIKEMLRFDTRVNDAMIDVKVNNGKVVLSGTVNSAAEKEQAQRDAWVAGVKSVDVTNLSVDPKADGNKAQKGKYSKKTDQQITSAVNNSLINDPRIDSDSNINAETKNGVVTLSGKVDNLSAKRTAEELARNRVGVTNVINNITVDTRNIDEAILKDKIEVALAIDPLADNYEIAVNTNNTGKVTLSGTVDSYFEKFHAENVASKVKGVSSVKNDLKVKDPYSLMHYYYMEPVVITAPRKSDAEIKEDIESHLWWSPFVDAEEVDVTVKNGKATLTGTVDSWSEEQSAIENAYEGGAIAVENKLSIDIDL